MTDHRSRAGTAGSIVFTRQHSSCLRWNTENLEKLTADKESLRVAPLAADREVEDTRVPREYPRERFLTRSQQLPLREGQLGPPAGEGARSPARRGEPDFEQLPRF